THVPGSDAHVPVMPPGAAGGAVYTTDAVPAPPVTMFRADKAPKSCATPLTCMSMRSDNPAMPLPSGPLAVTRMDDCDPPSWLMASGLATTLSESAKSDGPDSVGVSAL